MNDVLGRRPLTPPGVQDWQATLAVGKSIFGYYDSLGDVVISADTAIPSVLDGPMAVRKFRDLTINAATANVTLTTQYRCRGLILLVEGNLLLQRTGSYVPSISMTARGARGHAGMGMYDGLIPDSITLSGKKLLQRDVLKFIRDNGYAIIDRWMWDEWGKYLGVSATAWVGGTVLLSVAGCGAAGTGPVNGSYGASSNGGGGGAGVNAPGGGGGGGASSVGGPSNSGYGALGRPWGGGPGGAGGGGLIGVHPYYTGDLWGGPGGYAGYGDGAGNAPIYPGNRGTGGILCVIVKGNIVINSGGIIVSDGSNGGDIGAHGGGGGSGGGLVAVVYGGAYTNNGTVRASGGVGGYGGYVGGAGGSGSVVTKTFGQMGWL